MHAQFYRCCGYTVEISAYQVELAVGQRGHLIHCELCGEAFRVPGDRENARQAIPTHFLAKHQLEGQLEDWHP